MEAKEGIEKQYVFSNGGGELEYLVEYDSHHFSVRPVEMEDTEQDLRINANPMLFIIVKVLQKAGEKINEDAVLSNAGLYEWGITKELLDDSIVTMDDIQNKFWLNCRHEELCVECGGKCCTTLTTSGCYGKELVGPLRPFELSNHRNAYRWVDEVEGKNDYCSGKKVPFLLKPQGKCLYLVDGKCTAEVKPLMCSQFTCLEHPYGVLPEGVSDLPKELINKAKQYYNAAVDRTRASIKSTEEATREFYRAYDGTIMFLNKLRCMIRENNIEIYPSDWDKCVCMLGMEDSNFAADINGPVF